MTRDLLIVAGAYLCGSIPFSFLVARLFGVRDVREVGSGNVGATNVMRSAGKGAGGLALLLDLAKGAVASTAATRLAPGTWLGAGAGLAAVIGHMYPVWLGFRGGKGVATGVGAFLPLAPAAGLGGLGAFVVVGAATRYVSVGSCVGAATLAALTFVTSVAPAVPASASAAALLIAWKHRGNLARVAAGTERRLGGGGAP
jgi:glycerol-3-phosphate acyltransferase PlsY